MHFINAIKKCRSTSAKFFRFFGNPKAGHQYNTVRIAGDSYVYHASLQRLLTQLHKYILKLVIAQLISFSFTLYYLLFYQRQLEYICSHKVINRRNSAL